MANKRYGKNAKGKTGNQNNSKYGGKGSNNDRRDVSSIKSGRGSSRYSNGDRKLESPQMNGLNDISWYARNPELLAAVARVPFPYKPGMLIDPGTWHLDGVTDDVTMSMRIPGVCALDYAYSIGHSTDVTSPASIAAKEMFGRIRSKFSGSLDADAPDILMYALAIDSIHAYIAYLKRIYRCLNLYTPNNRDYPETILAAMGVDVDAIDDLQANKPLMWNRINTLVHMVNKFILPDDMDLYKRHRWMNENVYVDEPKAASQSFVFVPTGFYVVNTTGDTGTALKFTNLIINWSDPAKYYEFGLDMIKALSDWEDAYTINGYMERAFEGANWYRAELIAEEEVLTPVYEPEVLTQIENFTGLGPVTNLDISQDPTTNALLHDPKATANVKFSPVLNLHTDVPTAAEVTIATRLMAYISEDGHVYAGTEIPISSSIYYRNENGVIEAHDQEYLNIYDVTDNSLATFGGTFDSVFRKTGFSHAPLTWVVAHNGTASRAWLVGDISNLSLVPRSTLDEITRVCVYSEFNCFR